MPDSPLVSCLCITRDRVPLIERAVACFLHQSYRPRELVVVYEADDPATPAYLDTLREPSIRPVRVNVSPRLRLGPLRNVAVRAARGEYIAQWDDDDWHAPDRLAEQLLAVRASGRPACVLSRWVLFDTATGAAFVSGFRPWEGSLVAVRAAVPTYPDRSQGEDTPVIVRLWANGKLIGLDRPDLYVYVCHGANTWRQRDYWANHFAAAEPLGPDDAARVRAVLTAHERPPAP